MTTQDEYLVDKVLNHRLRPDQSPEFELSWEGYGDTRTWEPLEALVMDPLKEYLRRKALTLEPIQVRGKTPKQRNSYD